MRIATLTATLLALSICLTASLAHASNGPWKGVLVSPHHTDLMATWDHQGLYVSHNGGHHTTAVLKQRPLNVQTATWDHQNNLLIIDGHNVLHRFTQQGQHHTQALPFVLNTVALIAQPQRLVHIGEIDAVAPDGDPYGPAISISTDHGKTWTHAYTSLGDTDTQVSADAAGQIQIISAHESGCGGGGQDRTLLNPQHPKEHSVPWPLDTALFAPGAQGWAYGVDVCVEYENAIQICAVSPTGAVFPIGSPNPQQFGGTFQSAQLNDTTYILQHQNLWKLQGSKGTLLNNKAPKDLQMLSVDAGGRPVGLVHGNVVRLNADGSWTHLKLKIRPSKP